MEEVGHPTPAVAASASPSRGMIEFTLPDGRRCRLEARRAPAATGPEPSGPVIHCEIDGQPPFAIPMHAGWAETAALPPGVADAVIRHYLLE